MHRKHLPSTLESLLRNICIQTLHFCYLQLRLDFTNFVITGPQTSSISVVKTTKGEVDAAGVAQSLASQCLTDTFSVTSGGTTPPVICGTNTGEHSKIFHEGTVHA